MAPLLSYQLFHDNSLYIYIFFILSERVIFCSLVAVNSWPIASATSCGGRRDICVAFRGTAGKIGGVGGSLF